MYIETKRRPPLIKKRFISAIKDVTIKNENDSIRISSKPEEISKYEITEWELQKTEEVAISDAYKENIIFETK